MTTTDDTADAALSVADSAFHETYSAAREGTQHDVPVLVVLATKLAVHVQGARREYSFERAFFHAAKSAAHAAVAAFTLAVEPTVPASTRARSLAALLQLLGDAARASDAAIDAAVSKELKPVLKITSEFVRQQLNGESKPADAAEFAATVGPQLLRLTEVTTRQQVSALHEAAERALASLSASERRTLQVVVIGDHQARVRSMGMQYFQRRFGERPEDADEHVTFGENVSTEDEALALVATRRLDQKIAKAFFGDEKRLQRDVLGDAAKRCIEGMDLTQIRAE